MLDSVWSSRWELHIIERGDIKEIIPVSIEENEFTLAIENEFQLGIIKVRYSNLIKTAFLYITDIKFKLEYVVGK